MAIVRPCANVAFLIGGYLMGSNNAIPRPEHPDPQRYREEWINLNGRWSFEIDSKHVGLKERWWQRRELAGNIVVPFCPESRLSGIGSTDFMPAAWYRRSFRVPTAWRGKRVRLHFGAVDFDTRVRVNGTEIGRHVGGYSPFCFEITDKIRFEAHNDLVVYVEDDNRSGLQPCGKQSRQRESHGCVYTRVTGIWQTVWLEAAGTTFVKELHIIPNLSAGAVTVLATIDGETEGHTFEAVVETDSRPTTVRSSARANGQALAKAAVACNGSTAAVTLNVPNARPWSPESPCLYCLQLQLTRQGNRVDTLRSYFGFREFRIDGHRLLLNGESIFLRWVLDQGYHPDGVYTARSDEELKADIERAKAMGFNGARLHEKVFEPRFLYWADRLGYLVSGEMGDWGADFTHVRTHHTFLQEWAAAVRRDRNHPSLVLWTPFNESSGFYGDHPAEHDAMMHTLHGLTKSLDPTRLIIDASGYVHAITDIYDAHTYEQDPTKFAAKFNAFGRTGSPEDAYRGKHNRHVPYQGQPYLVSEYGGIWWDPQAQGGESGWGYGDRPSSQQEFLDRYRALTETLLNNPRICGFVYTQLYDIEQEVNGLYSYARQPKFDPAVIRRINQQLAAIER